MKNTLVRAYSFACNSFQTNFIPDPPYTQTFLLTYRTFTTPNQLLNILKARYHMEPPKNAPKDWTEKVQKPIRLRLFNALKNWLLKGFHDFADNPKLRKNLLNFLDDMSVEMASTAKNLRNVFDRKVYNISRFFTQGD